MGLYIGTQFWVLSVIKLLNRKKKFYIKIN
jgi:hypothetical protein